MLIGCGSGVAVGSKVGVEVAGSGVAVGVKVGVRMMAAAGGKVGVDSGAGWQAENRALNKITSKRGGRIWFSLGINRLYQACLRTK